jgi:bifunctional non-homologous end joining protein LigD
VGLDEYNRKRDFEITSEPPGKPARKRGRERERIFVIQKHAASRLHYDFRLELEGVLKSWSVPKGPSLDPKVKRLAMQTEDHPVEYASFEGIIPAGQYGGGTVLLWDRGTWEPQGDPHKDLAAGNLKFLLKGDKLHGGFALVKLRGRGPARGGGRGDERSWLLIKERDDEARAETDSVITDARPESVATQRTLDEIAGDRSRVWHSDRARVDMGAAPGARVAPLPERLRPPGLVARAVPPTEDGWLHELAVDGERLLARAERGEVTLLGERGAPLAGATARRMKPVADAVRMLPAETLVVDGWVTALSPDGHTSAAGLGDALAGKGDGSLAYYLFDLPYLDGHDLATVPLERRKALLAALVARVRERSPLRYAQHVEDAGDAVFEQACRLGAAGVISRRADGPYVPTEVQWTLASCAPAKAKNRTKARTIARVRRAPVASRRSDARAATEVAGVRLTHPERLLWPDAGISKLDLARYYQRMAPFLLPQVSDRPLTLVRCPDGLRARQRGGGGSRDPGCFYMKHSGVWAPAALDRVQIQEKTKVGEYLVVRDLAGLVALAQMSILEIHVWNATTAALERPDRVVFDLDPDPEVPWARVVAAALELRARLAALELASLVKTTGGKGLHVVVPFAPRLGWDDCFAFSRAVAEAMERAAPDAFVTVMPKARRKGKIFIDVLRNNRGNTAVAGYSPRARPAAPVSTPLRWEELSPALDPAQLTMAAMPERLARLRGDPWAKAVPARQKLTAALLRKLATSRA